MPPKTVTITKKKVGEVLTEAKTVEATVTSTTTTTKTTSTKKKQVITKPPKQDLFDDDNVDYRYIMANYDFKQNKTRPMITKYEKSLLVGKRAKQLESGATPNVKVMSGQSAIEIAEEELRVRKIPLLIKRPIGNKYEYWKPEDMEVDMD